jgi:hypothetical protein
MKKTIVDYIIDVGIAISIGLFGFAAYYSFA